jgi:hypothetical protein
MLTNIYLLVLFIVKCLLNREVLMLLIFHTVKLLFIVKCLLNREVLMLLIFHTVKLHYWVW